MSDEVDRVGLAYLERLTEADLRTLVQAERVPDTEAGARIGALRGAPGLVLDVLDRPATSSALLNLTGDQGGQRWTFVSPFLMFAAAIHRTAHDLAATRYAAERSGPRLRVPVFDTAELAAYLARPRHRLFLAELLASFARTSSGVATTRTPRGVRRQRWNDLDLTRLAVLLDAVPESQRPTVWRRLGDLSLFLAGVFPDAVARSGPGAGEATLLARRTGLRSLPPSGLRDLDLLEWLGAGWYRLAAQHAPSGNELADVAEHVHHACRVLNAAADRYLLPVSVGWFTPPGRSA